MKKKLLIFLTLIFMTPFVIKAEELQMEWQKSWGGTGDDNLNNVIVTEDGNFILVGSSSSIDIEGLPNKGSQDAIIVKYDKDGNMLWQKSWGGTGDDNLNNVIVTEDGNIMLFGESNSTDIEGLPNKGSKDIILVKYDKDGNMLWQKSWGGNGWDSLKNAIETEDGNFILGGYSDSSNPEGLYSGGLPLQDAIIVKYDKDGNILWQKSCGFRDNVGLKNVIETEDGSIILSGNISSIDLPNKGYLDAIILKYDKDGNMLWQKSWGGNSYDYFENVIETEDGSIILFGYTYSTDIEGLPKKGSVDIIMVKYDKNGNMLWQKSCGGNGWDSLNNVIETKDGNFILVGESYSTDIEGLPNKGSNDTIIVKFDKDGNMLWQKSWGGDENDNLNNVIETEDGNIILFGRSSSTDIEGLPNKGSDDTIIVKYDKDGNMLWQKSWGGNQYDALNNVIETEDGGIILYGTSSSTDIEGLPNKGSDDIILVKYSIEYDLGNVEAENGSAELKQEGKYGIITPTPNEGYEVDKIIIKDIDGNILDIETTKREDGTYSFELYTDVSIEVIYKEKIENPKTGIIDIITILIIGFMMSISGLFLVKKYNERLEF